MQLQELEAGQSSGLSAGRRACAPGHKEVSPTPALAAVAWVTGVVALLAVGTGARTPVREPQPFCTDLPFTETGLYRQQLPVRNSVALGATGVRCLGCQNTAPQAPWLPQHIDFLRAVAVRGPRPRAVSSEAVCSSLSPHLLFPPYLGVLKSTSSGHNLLD